MTDRFRFADSATPDIFALTGVPGMLAVGSE
jgi:hypothetical protein